MKRFAIPALLLTLALCGVALAKSSKRYCCYSYSYNRQQVWCIQSPLFDDGLEPSVNTYYDTLQYDDGPTPCETDPTSVSGWYASGKPYPQICGTSNPCETSPPGYRSHDSSRDIQLSKLIGQNEELRDRMFDIAAGIQGGHSFSPKRAVTKSITRCAMVNTIDGPKPIKIFIMDLDWDAAGAPPYVCKGNRQHTLFLGLESEGLPNECKKPPTAAPIGMTKFYSGVFRVQGIPNDVIFLTQTRLRR